MSLIARPFEVGDLRGTIYTLEKVGDEFPLHSHGHDDIHITIVAGGRLKCFGRPAIEGKEIKPPMILDWKEGEPHGFVALEDNSVLVNIRKYMNH